VRGEAWDDREERDPPRLTENVVCPLFAAILGVFYGGQDYETALQDEVD